MSSLLLRQKLTPARIRQPSPKLSTKGSSKAPKKSKKPRPIPILVAVKPLNIDYEKEKFFQSKGKYDPQFVYCDEASSPDMSRFGESSTKYLEQALKIVNNGLKIFGSYSKWEKNCGGRIMTNEEIYKCVRGYLQAQGMEDEVQINITRSLLSNASMSRVGGKPTVNLREGAIHINWISGMLNHEIGTHYIRAYNNGKQPWKSKKYRKKLGLLPANPTEEGLASINTHLDREQPVLIRSALIYVTIHLASQMSFSQAFKSLKQYIDCPETRWTYLMRAKRGQTDTSQPGCFPKDQMYLPGILQILSKRREIDFDKLHMFGKVSFKDIDKLSDKAVCTGTRIPHFLLDKEHYMERLERIMECNGLIDEELSALC